MSSIATFASGLDVAKLAGDLGMPVAVELRDLLVQLGDRPPRCCNG